MGKRLVLVALLLMNALPGAAHGPGKRLDPVVTFCHEKQSGEIQVLTGARAGGTIPFCLDVVNDEPVAIAFAMSLIPGLITEQGKSACLAPATPSRGQVWLEEGGEDGIFRMEVASHGTWRQTLHVRVSSLADYPADDAGAPAFRGWLGCLLLEGRAVGDASGHKSARILRMMRAIAQP